MNEKIKELHAQGKTNREISGELKVTPQAINYWIKKLKLVPHGKRRFSLKIVKGKGVCSKCNSSKSLDNFRTNKRNSEHSYKQTYCNDCRQQQMWDNINSGIKQYLSYRLWRLKSKVKRNKGIFTISQENLYKLWIEQKGKCFYTDVELKWRVGKGYDKNSLSVDKVIPEKGYIDGNVVLCTHQINSCKNDLTLEEIKKWMPTWYKRIQRKFKKDGTKTTS
jgi:G3E family GTPase